MKKQKHIFLFLLGLSLIPLCAFAAYALSLSPAAKMGAASLFSLGDISNSAQIADSVATVPAEDGGEVVPPVQPAALEASGSAQTTASIVILPSEDGVVPPAPAQPAAPESTGSAQTTASIVILPAEDGDEVLPPAPEQPAAPKTTGSAQTTASIVILPAETE
jgi:hypothetical protein